MKTPIGPQNFLISLSVVIKKQYGPTMEFRGNLVSESYRFLGVQYMEQEIVKLVQNVEEAKFYGGQYTVTGK